MTAARDLAATATRLIDAALPWLVATCIAALIAHGAPVMEILI